MHPNPIWGYGMLDLIKVFQNIRSIDKSAIKKQSIVQFTNNVFIRIPEGIYNSLNNNIF